MGRPAGGSSSTHTRTHYAYPHPPSRYRYSSRVWWVSHPQAYPQVWEKCRYMHDIDVQVLLTQSKLMPPSISSSSSTSGNAPTFRTSSFLTSPRWLHAPRHSNACVESTDKQQWTCERSSRPQLKRHSTSIEVANCYERTEVHCVGCTSLPVSK